jgi:hypothetical protein
MQLPVVIEIDPLSVLLFFPPAVPPAMPSAKLALTVLYADNLRRTTGRAFILSVSDGFHILVAFCPFITAILALYGADISGKVTALYMNDLSIYQAVGYFFSCRQKDALEGGAGHFHLFGALALLKAFQVFQTDGLQLFKF